MKSCKMSGLPSVEDTVTGSSTCEGVKDSFDNSEYDVPSSQDSETNLESNERCGSSFQEAACSNSVSSGVECDEVILGKGNRLKKKARSSQCSQLSLMSFFKKSKNVDNVIKDSCTDIQEESSQLDLYSTEASPVVDQSGSSEQYELSTDVCEDVSKFTDDPKRKESNNVALLEWQRIQQLMQNSIPLCKGHKEPCIARVVKKQGHNFGRRFYVCARAEVNFFIDNHYDHLRFLYEDCLK